jgi:filamentous hemagglutinin family protein
MSTRSWGMVALGVLLSNGCTWGWMASNFKGEAQIIPDATLGAEQSSVTTIPAENGSIDRIEGGAVRGSHLFHSFSDFNVNPEQRVYFANPEAIDTILGRVTGFNTSTIDGTLGVAGNANLFLINPNGFVFGPSATLDIRGSFTASTSEQVPFPGGFSFSTVDPVPPPLMTINAPLGLSAWLPTAGDIISYANLTAGENLALVGHNLSLQGQLQAGQNVSLIATGMLFAGDEESSFVSEPDGVDPVIPLDGGITTLLDEGEAFSIVPVGTGVEDFGLPSEVVVDRPFTVNAGNQILMQGNQDLVIRSLNRSESGLFAGGDIVLRSDAPVTGETNFTAGGNFQIERLDGRLGDLVSNAKSPVIEVAGNFSAGNYIGLSLQIWAGGNVTIPGTVEITGFEFGANDDPTEPIDPDFTLLELPETPLAEGPNVPFVELPATSLEERLESTRPGTLSLPEAVTDVRPSPGAVRAVSITQAGSAFRDGPVVLSNGTSVDINGTTQPTLDIRAGTTQLSGRPLAGTATEANISIGTIINPGGLVYLTNQFQPNPALAGDITVDRIVTASVPNIDDTGSDGDGLFVFNQLTPLLPSDFDEGLGTPIDMSPVDMEEGSSVVTLAPIDEPFSPSLVDDSLVDDSLVDDSLVDDSLVDDNDSFTETPSLGDPLSPFQFEDSNSFTEIPVLEQPLPSSQFEDSDDFMALDPVEEPPFPVQAVPPLDGEPIFPDQNDVSPAPLEPESEDGGEVVVDARGGLTFDVIQSSGGDITTLDILGNGGDVTLLAQGEILLPFPSYILSYGLQGGAITLDSETAITQVDAPLGTPLSDLSLVESLSLGPNQGGNVTLKRPDPIHRRQCFCH